MERLIGRYDNNPTNHIKNYCKDNWFFILLLCVAFVSMCLSIYCRPFALLTLTILLMGACFLNCSKIVILIILFCFTFNGLTEYQISSVNDIGTNSVFFGLATIIIAIKYLIKLQIEKPKQKLNFSLLLVLSMFLIYIILPIYEFKINILWMFAFFIGFYCVFEMRADFNLQETINYSAVGLIVASLLSFVVRTNADLAESLGSFYVYGVLKFQALFFNPNFLGIYCLIIISFLMLIQSRNWERWRLILIVIMYGIGVTTISRSFIICSSLSWCVFFCILMFKYKKRGLLRIFSSVVCVILCLILLYPYSKVYILRFKQMIPNSKITAVAEELTKNDNDLLFDFADIKYCDKLEVFDWCDDVSEAYDNPSREVLLKLYWEDYISTPMTILFGRGIYASHEVGMAPHNSYIGMLWNIGLVGTMLFYAIIVYVLYKLKFQKEVLLFILPLLILGLVETLFFTKWFWLIAIMFTIGGKNNGFGQCNCANLQSRKVFK